MQTHIRELGQQLRAWGHDVRIVAPCSDTSKVEDEGFIPMGKPFPLPSRGSVGRISVSVWLRSKIKEMLDEQQFDIIHMHEPFSSYVCVGMLSQSSAVNIATFHAYPGSRVMDLGGARIAQPYFKMLHGRIAVSQPAKEFISGYFESDYKIIPNGVRIDQYQQGVEPFPHLQDGMINLLFLGRADKRKGLKYLLLAYSKLKWDWPNLRLIVLGPGNPNDECQRIIGERSLQDVMFVGAVSDEDKFRYLKTADVYCSPATGGESFGMVLVEAMAAGPANRRQRDSGLHDGRAERHRGDDLPAERCWGAGGRAGEGAGRRRSQAATLGERPAACRRFPLGARRASRARLLRLVHEQRPPFRGSPSAEHALVPISHPCTDSAAFSPPSSTPSRASL